MGDNKESKGRKRRKLLLGISKMTDKDIYTGDSDNIDNKVNKINKENKSPTDKYSDIHKDNGSAGINESEDVFDFVISAPKAQTDKTASEYRGVRRINRASKTYKSRERINNKRPGLYNITQDKVSQDRISSDRISSDKISSDKTSPDKTGSYKTSSYRKNSDKPNLYKSNSDKIDLYKTGSEKTNTDGTDDLRKKGIYSRKKRKRKKLQKYGNPIIDQFIITDQLIIAAWLIPIKHLKTIKILKITIPKTCIICLNLILKSMKQNNRILKNI